MLNVFRWVWALFVLPVPRWVASGGDNHVCSCCEATCSTQRRSRRSSPSSDEGMNPQERTNPTPKYKALYYLYYGMIVSCGSYLDLKGGSNINRHRKGGKTHMESTDVSCTSRPSPEQNDPWPQPAHHWHASQFIASRFVIKAFTKSVVLHWWVASHKWLAREFWVGGRAYAKP